MAIDDYDDDGTEYRVLTVRTNERLYFVVIDTEPDTSGLRIYEDNLENPATFDIELL